MLSAIHDTKRLVLPYYLNNCSAFADILKQTEQLNGGQLIAAAGFGSSGPLLKANIANELQMITINCEVPLAMSYFFGERFAKQKRGGITLFSSLLDFHGAPNSANYATTKGYIQCPGEGLYVELKSHNIDVLISAPGSVANGFAEVANMQMNLAA